jgi:hypothetical protein
LHGTPQRLNTLALGKNRRQLSALAPDQITGEGMGSNAPGKEKDDNDQENQSHATARGITPTSAVRPAWQYSEKDQNQNYDQDCSKHGVLL